jgi:hypothetical protein
VVFDTGTVGKYDAKTGAAINANFIAGLNLPSGLAVNGNTLFVANEGNGTVGKYDAKTGAAINANFIAGLSFPVGLAVMGNTNTLFVAGVGDTVGKYDANTGAVINANFIVIGGVTRLLGIALLGNNLFVMTVDVNFFTGAVAEYDATTGAAINANFITGLQFFPSGIAVK